MDSDCYVYMASQSSLEPDDAASDGFHDGKPKVTTISTALQSLVQSSVYYMRSPSPDDGRGSIPDPGPGGLQGFVSELSPLVSPGSSPLLSCPPAWLQLDPELEDDDDKENEAECFDVVVPLSSSPPDLASSSPHSAHSSGSEENSSSLTSDSLESLSDEASESISEQNPSLVSLTESGESDDFGPRLHHLLTVALKEQELDLGGLDDGQITVYHADLECQDTGDFGFDDPHLENQISADNGSCGLGNQSTPPTRDYDSSPTHFSKWFVDQVQTDRAALGVLKPRAEKSPGVPAVENVSEEISPIRFEPRPNAHTSPSSILGLATMKTLPTYRIIKRAQSYIPNCDLVEGTDEPLIKRQKTSRDSGAHARERVYARRTASLRRADSLRSVPADDARTPKSAEYVPTVPATPTLPKSNTVPQESTSTKVLAFPVPIIAPPEGHVAKLPLSTETLAKMRLRKFLEREEKQREKDALPFGICERPPTWMLQEALGYDRYKEEDNDGGDPSFEWEVIMGVGEKKREEVVSWILDVLPAAANQTVSDRGRSTTPSESSMPSSQGSAFTSTSASSLSECQYGSNLLDQLKNSPETRFHAAWMCLRYFYLTMAPNSGSRTNEGGLSRTSSLDSKLSSSTEREGRDLVVWDIAVGCLSLSVKFHRDFLHPLLPVYAYEYLALAPHAMAHEDLETAHRDILSAFDFSLGVTPQLVMDELWIALPSLRNLLDFEGGWQYAMEDAWLFLFDAVDEPDVLKFPISMLTVVALTDGIVESLVRRYRLEEMTNTAIGSFSRLKTFEERAKEKSEGVICDIQALIGVTDVQLRECRAWTNRLQ